MERGRFRDRREAGAELAVALAHLADERPVVVGLPRGGVVVAAEVATALAAALDVVIVRKLGAPFQPEYALGALGEEDVLVVDHATVDALRLHRALERVLRRERRELERRSQRYRADRAPIAVADRTVVLVDDGIATGSTARAAAEVLRARGAARIVLAVPVGPADVDERFAGVVDEVVCLERPDEFLAVGTAYRDFAPTSDEQVVALLAADRERP